MTDNPYEAPQKENWIPKVPRKTIFLVVFMVIFSITGFFLYRGYQTWKMASAALDASAASIKQAEAEEAARIAEDQAAAKDE